METLSNYVAGAWVDPRAAGFVDVCNPAVGEVIARTPLSTGVDLDAAASMVGVNIGVASPMAPFPFGGARDSFFGDLKA